MLKFLIQSMIFFFLIDSNTVFAYLIDSYGVHSTHTSALIQKYQSDILRIETDLFNMQRSLEQPSSSARRTNDEAKIIALLSEKQHLIDKMKQEGQVLYVGIDTVQYWPIKSKPIIYTTVEMIEQNDADRLRFVTSSEADSVVESRRGDLIDDMRDFQALAQQFYIEKRAYDERRCPVFHCIANFDEPEAKPYLKKFNQQVVLQKQFVIDTLQHDPASERRAAAAFLIAHFKDPNEILSLLIPAMMDKSTLVRNNVLRVLGQTISKAHIKEMDLMPFINFLDSPYLTDRNKALLVLNSAADIPSASIRQQLLDKGRAYFIEFLALKQPNHHDIAYQLLKKMSGKNYADTDLKAWYSWSQTLSSQSTKL